MAAPCPNCGYSRRLNSGSSAERVFDLLNDPLMADIEWSNQDLADRLNLGYDTVRQSVRGLYIRGLLRRRKEPRGYRNHPVYLYRAASRAAPR